MNIKEIAIKCLEDESKAILDLIPLINNDFEKAIDLIYNCKGKLIISGVGKSGHIGAKLAATFASTGTPSFFLNPTDAIHGDLGMLSEGDILFLISNSGQTDELLKIIPFIENKKIIIIGMTSNPKSLLAKKVVCHIIVTVEKEADPLNIAPTSSTTAMLAMGDAIAIALMQKRRFKITDYAMLHPGGSIGKKLLLKVKDIMYTKNLPIISEDETIENMLSKITKGKLGVVVVLSERKIKGLITNGDLRRALENNKNNIFNMKINEIANPNPIYIYENESLLNADTLFKEKNINMVLVIDSNDNFSGILDIREM